MKGRKEGERGRASSRNNPEYVPGSFLEMVYITLTCVFL